MKKTRNPGPGSKKASTRAVKALLTAGMMICMMLAIAPPAFAGVGLAVTPSVQDPVEVGDTGLAASLLITNGSDGAQATQDVTVTNIVMTMSCGTFSTPCAEPDLGVFALSATGTGTAGACNGLTFIIGAPDGTGGVTLTPSGPVVLDPVDDANDFCRVAFTYDVLKVPGIDAFPGTAGVQTRTIASADAEATDTTQGGGVGSDISRVDRAATSVSTQASAGGILGTEVTDTATLSGGVNPTGTMTFNLYGPDDDTCAGEPVFTSTVPVAGNGPIVSEGFTPAQAGTYRWIAAYSGDANNAPSELGACDDENEDVAVSASPTPSPSPTPTPTGTPTPGPSITPGPSVAPLANNTVAVNEVHIAPVGAVGAGAGGASEDGGFPGAAVATGLVVFLVAAALLFLRRRAEA